eukprot:TRINITY_DN3731_c0_g2_i14.p1 TRINITY_DN3731_c0_g2~~TRINITY_DN3731_c0_g2_i14.p1  ORF type:complete len:709 (+),score=149.41 TRINITY_DN3731_c0_g2_i14:223-2349(+)
MGYAVACALNDDYDRGISVLDQYCSVQKQSGVINQFEESELLLFKATILENKNDLEGALKFLDDHCYQITDKESLKTKRAELLTKLGRIEDAAKVWSVLIDGNPEQWSYHLGYLKTSGILPYDHPSCWQSVELSSEKVVDLIATYDGFVSKYPYARTCKQIPFAFISGELFTERFTPYFCTSLTKGTSTIFTTVKYLYSNPEKVKLIEEIGLKVKDLLESDKPLPGNLALEPPSSLLFCYYYLAQHYHKQKNSKEALMYIDKCIQHTPTQVDWYVFRARILKGGGNPQSASNWMEKARSLDLADRYLNTKATLYFLRADKPKTAEETISIFTKVEADLEHNYNNILDMQVIWYEQEEGECWARMGNYGQALKRFYDIKKHFEDFRNDQMDFHTYCTKKMTLRQYVNLLKFADNIYSHNFYFRAACNVVKCFLYIHDNPEKLSLYSDEALATMPEKDRKKILADKRKEDARKQKEIDERKAIAVKKGKTIDMDDFFGDKLVSLGLKGAITWVRDLEVYSPTKIDTHLLSFEVAFRRRKYLLALKAINKASAIDPSNANIHYCIVRFFHALTPAVEATLHPNVLKLLLSAKTSFLGDLSLEEYNQIWIKKASGIKERIIFYNCAVLLGGEKESLFALLTDTSDHVGKLKEFVEVLRLLEKDFPDKVDEWKATARELHPLASVFQQQTVPCTETPSEERNWFEEFLTNPKA